MTKKENEKSCSNCRYFTGWDGGFDGEPMTTECIHYGNTPNRKNCPKFKRPYPKGFELLIEFREWFNGQGYRCDCMDTPVTIDYEDIRTFYREWKWLYDEWETI